MSDLDRYLTDEVVEQAARAEWEREWPDRPWERAPDDVRDFYMSVARISLSIVLPDIIQQAKAEAWDEALQARAGWMQDQRYYVEDEVPNPYRERGES